MKVYLFDCILCDDSLWPRDEHFPGIEPGVLKSKRIAFVRIARNFPKYKGKIMVCSIEEFERLFNNEEIKDSYNVLIG